MNEPPADPALVSGRTLEHYSERAAAFWAGTRDHDVQQNIAALLRHIAAAPPLRILDFGCGPGRDLAAFRALGHEPVGVEGSPVFAAMAREYSGCEVWEQNFLALKLPAGRFHGIFANASLFHVPGQELPRVLAQLHAALLPAGVLFASNPRGNNEEGWSHGRYGVTTIWNRGARSGTRRSSTNWSITFVPPGCRSSNSRGWQPYGANEAD